MDSQLKKIYIACYYGSQSLKSRHTEWNRKLQEGFSHALKLRYAMSVSFTSDQGERECYELTLPPPALTNIPRQRKHCKATRILKKTVNKKYIIINNTCNIS